MEGSRGEERESSRGGGDLGSGQGGRKIPNRTAIWGRDSESTVLKEIGVGKEENNVHFSAGEFGYFVNCMDAALDSSQEHRNIVIT